MWIFGWKGPSGFSASSTAEEVTHGIDGTDLTAIVTGASSGIGAETTRVLAMRGVHVVMAVRNMNAGRNVKDAILKELPTAKIDVMELDLSSMASVRKFASEYTFSSLPLNILINNAGVLASPTTLSEDNIELQFATNHIGHFLLTNLLLEMMKNTARHSNKEGRIINVSSLGHRVVSREGICFDKISDVSSWFAYGQSKLANILHANELARRLKEEGADITANSLHPGIIYTNLLRHQGFLNGVFDMIGKYVSKNVQQGAATTCYLALHPQVKGVTGEYFVDCNVTEPSSQAKDAELAKKLWDFSLSITNTMAITGDGHDGPRPVLPGIPVDEISADCVNKLATGPYSEGQKLLLVPSGGPDSKKRVIADLTERFGMRQSASICISVASHSHLDPDEFIKYPPRFRAYGYRCFISLKLKLKCFL